LLPGRSTAQDNPCILLAGRHLIAVNSITLENLLVIEDGIYTLTAILGILSEETGGKKIG